MKRYITADEFYRAEKSYYTTRLGAVMYSFIHDPRNYKLKYSDQVIEDPIKIYIKLLPDYEEDCNVAIISFHDPDDSI